MSEMFVQTPDVIKILEDYDLVFSSGIMMPITIDRKAGDTIAIGQSTIEAHLVGKPSMNDPGKLLPAEDITVYMTHLVSIQRRTREVVELSPEEQFDWQKTFKQMVTSTVQ